MAAPISAVNQKSSALSVAKRMPLNFTFRLERLAGDMGWQLRRWVLVNGNFECSITPFLCPTGAMLSFRGRCFSFNNTADGYGRGEGCAAAVIARGEPDGSTWRRETS